MELYYRRLKVGETVNEKKKSFQLTFFVRLPTRTQERQPERIVHCGLHPRIHGVHRLYVDAPDKSSGKRRPASWKAATTKPKLPSVWATVFAMTIISFLLIQFLSVAPQGSVKNLFIIPQLSVMNQKIRVPMQQYEGRRGFCYAFKVTPHR